ncbi:hypothetical protein L3Y34_010347 [Caenorhabditis briggsae]|uniref:Uncharacterized protein n=1 Tax=Caenorhabditis briggsae TaxID=6238 RepID=A0AAE9CSY3_CAEBR|nr:hypothetical protein L3Y34_010347 [Caenorhabditis briggsae]
MSDWMGRLPCFVKKKAFCMLAIPGSHDSGAFWFNLPLGYAHDQAFIDYVRRFKCMLIKNIFKRWGLTQNLTIVEQLENGIRFFDLRLELALDERCFASCFIVHGLYGTDWLKLVHQIVSFLAIHTEEVIILNASHTYRMDDQHFRRFFLHPLKRVASRFQIGLCSTKVDLRTITLEELLCNNFRIIVVGPKDQDVDDICFRAAAIQNKWPRKNNAADILTFLKAEIHAPITPGLRVLQGVITPKLSDVIRNFRNSLRTMFSMPLRGLIKEWLAGLDEEEAGLMNIIITDQVDTEFCRLAYYLNVADCPDHSLDDQRNPHLDTNPVVNDIPKGIISSPRLQLIETKNGIAPPARRYSEPEFLIEEIFDDELSTSSDAPKKPIRASVMIQQIEMVPANQMDGRCSSPVSPVPPPKPRRHTQRIPFVMEVEPIPDDVMPCRSITRGPMSRPTGTPVRIALPVTAEELRLAALGEYPPYGTGFFYRVVSKKEGSITEGSIFEDTIVDGPQELALPASTTSLSYAEECEASADESSPLISTEIEHMVENLVINSTLDAMDNLAGRFQKYSE